MQTLKNKYNEAVLTTRELTVTYEQLIKLLDSTGQDALPLVHPQLKIIFEIDLEEFRSFSEYYKDFTYRIEVNNHIDTNLTEIEINNVL